MYIFVTQECTLLFQLIISTLHRNNKIKKRANSFKEFLASDKKSHKAFLLFSSFFLIYNLLSYLKKLQLPIILLLSLLIFYLLFVPIEALFIP